MKKFNPWIRTSAAMDEKLMAGLFQFQTAPAFEVGRVGYYVQFSKAAAYACLCVSV